MMLYARIEFLRVEMRNNRQRIIALASFNRNGGSRAQPPLRIQEVVLPYHIRKPKLYPSDVFICTSPHLIGNVFRIEHMRPSIPYMPNILAGTHARSAQILRRLTQGFSIDDSMMEELERNNWEFNFDANEIRFPLRNQDARNLASETSWQGECKAIATATPRISITRSATIDDRCMKQLELQESRCPKCGELRLECIPCRKCGLRIMGNPIKWIVTVDSEQGALAPFATYDRFSKSTVRKKVKERLRDLKIEAKTCYGLSRYAGIYVADTGEMLKQLGQAV